MAAAYAEDTVGWWPLPAPKTPVLTKTRVTRSSKDQPFAIKEEAAWEHTMALRRSADTDFTGKRILLVDDVCTTGLQLNYIACRLRTAGAADVRGLVLARTPWRY